MAQYRAIIEGNRGAASRLGSKKSGMSASVNGWNIGVRVYLNYNEETGEDVATVYLTGGSNGRISSKLIGEYKESELDEEIRKQRLEEGLAREKREAARKEEEERLKVCPWCGSEDGYEVVGINWQKLCRSCGEAIAMPQDIVDEIKAERLERLES